MIKKYSNLPIVITLIGMLLTACIPVTQVPITNTIPTDTGLPNSQVTITIWHHWTSDTLKAIQPIFNQYMAEHSNVSVVLDQPESFPDALKYAIPAIEGPDIIDWTNDQIGSQAQVGNIIDLGILGVTQDALNTAYEPAAVNGILWQGKIWALPESQEGIAIIYNKKLASEADFPSDPMDFPGLIDKAKAYAEKNPGKFLLCNPGLGNADAFYEAPIYFGFGMPGYVDDTGKVNFNTPEGIAAGNWIKEFMPYSPSQTSQDICSNLFTGATVAAEWTGPWAIAGIEQAGIDYGILPMGKSFVRIRSLMISKNAVDRGNAEVALDLIKYLTNQTNQAKLSLENLTVPANTAALNEPDVQAVAFIKGFGIAAHSGIPLGTTPYANAQWIPVGEATMAIWNGSQSVEEALAAAQAAIENSITGMR